MKAIQAPLGHASAGTTLDTYERPVRSELEALADRLELVRDAALAKRSRTQRGPTESGATNTAGQQAKIAAEAEGFEPSRRL